MSASLRRPPKSVRSDRGLTTAPESRCDPGPFPFSSTATGTSPRRSATSGCSSSNWPNRIAHASPAGPAPTISRPTSIRSSAGSVGRAIASAAVHGGGKSTGLTVIPAPSSLRRSRAPALPDELGELRDDLVQVADDAEVGVLEDRRVPVLVDRDDRAGRLHADLV